MNSRLEINLPSSELTAGQLYIFSCWFEWSVDDARERRVLFATKNEGCACVNVSEARTWFEILKGTSDDGTPITYEVAPGAALGMFTFSAHPYNPNAPKRWTQVTIIGDPLRDQTHFFVDNDFVGTAKSCLKEDIVCIGNKLPSTESLWNGAIGSIDDVRFYSVSGGETLDSTKDKLVEDIHKDYTLLKNCIDRYGDAGDASDRFDFGRKFSHPNHFLGFPCRQLLPSDSFSEHVINRSEGIYLLEEQEETVGPNEDSRDLPSSVPSSPNADGEDDTEFPELSCSGSEEESTTGLGTVFAFEVDEDNNFLVLRNNLIASITSPDPGLGSLGGGNSPTPEFQTVLARCDGSLQKMLVIISKAIVFAGRNLWALFKSPTEIPRVKSFVTEILLARACFDVLRQDYLSAIKWKGSDAYTAWRSSESSTSTLPWVDELGERVEDPQKPSRFYLEGIEPTHPNLKYEWVIEICLICNGEREGKGVVCESCGFQFHEKCCEMEADDAQAFEVTPIDGLPDYTPWQCPMCFKNKELQVAVLDNDLPTIDRLMTASTASPFWRNIHHHNLHPSDSLPPRTLNAIHQASIRNHLSALKMVLSPFRCLLLSSVPNETAHARDARGCYRQNGGWGLKRLLEMPDEVTGTTAFDLAIMHRSMNVASQLFLWGVGEERRLHQVRNSLAQFYGRTSANLLDISLGREPNVPVAMAEYTKVRGAETLRKCHTIPGYLHETEKWVYITESIWGKDIPVQMTGCRLKRCACGIEGCDGDSIVRFENGVLQLTGNSRNTNECSSKHAKVYGGKLAFCNYTCQCYTPARIIEDPLTSRLRYDLTRRSLNVCNRSFHRYGLKTHLEVYYENEHVGWGVRAKEKLKAGSFVCEYVGEIISVDSEEERMEANGGQALRFTFEIERNKYVIDATRFRNVASFCNHSCRGANLKIQMFYSDHLDKSFPRVGLFSKRSIDVGEPLTLNYCDGAKTKLFDPCFCASCLEKANVTGEGGNAAAQASMHKKRERDSEPGFTKDYRRHWGETAGDVHRGNRETMNNFFDEGLPDVILLDSYADKRNGQNVVQKGFQSYFKRIATKERLYLYLPINGSKTSVKEWVKFYKDNRAERTAKEKGFGNTKNMFYHFVKKEPRNPANDDYYYAIPKGFTQSDLLNKESDYSYMVAWGCGSVRNRRRTVAQANTM
eukprot:g3703.t1